MKNYVKQLVLIVLISLPGILSAQILGIRGGVNLANLTAKDDDVNYSEDFKSKLGFQAGLTAEFPMSDMISFETGLLLSTKGAKLEDSDDEVTSTGTMNLNYLEIPLTAKAYFSEGPTRVFGLLGPYLGYGISGKTKYEWGGETETEDIEWGSDAEEDDFKRLDFGLTAGLGLNFSSIEVGLTYNFSLANLSPDTEDGMKISNKVIGLYLGLKFGGKQD